MQHVFPVTEHGRPPAAACSIDDIRDVIAEELGRRLLEMDLEELVAATVVEEYRGRPVGLEPAYELRYRDFRFTEQGIAGRVSRRLFLGTVTYTLDQLEASLRAEQPHCDWRLVAATIEQVDRRTSVPIPFQGDAPRGINPAVDHDNPPEVFPQGRRHAYTQAPDYVWMGRLVYCDVSNGQLVDPQVEQGEKAGPMSAYIETKQIRHMSAGSRKNREQCLKVIAAYAEHRLEMADGAKSRITPDVVHKAIALRREGVGFPMLGQTFGVDPDALEAACTIELTGGADSAFHQAAAEAAAESSSPTTRRNRR